MFEIDPLLRIQRGQVIEENLVAGRLGILEIDFFYFEQRKIPLAFLGRADLPGYDVSRSEIESADLRGRDVNVVRTGEVVGIRRPQESEAVGERFQHAFSVDHTVFFGLCLEDRENQLLLAEVCRALDLQISGDLVQLGDISLFELG